MCVCGGWGGARVCEVDGLVADDLEEHGAVAEAIATQDLDAADESVAGGLVFVEKVAAQENKVNLQSLQGTGNHCQSLPIIAGVAVMGGGLCVCFWCYVAGRKSAKCFAAKLTWTKMVRRIRGTKVVMRSGIMVIGIR